MTRYTDVEGHSIILCDQCRQDIPVGGKAFTLSPGKVAEGYVSRDYEKADMVLCPVCAHTMGRVLAIMGTRYADHLIIHQEAA